MRSGFSLLLSFFQSDKIECDSCASSTPSGVGGGLFYHRFFS